MRGDETKRGKRCPTISRWPSTYPAFPSTARHLGINPACCSDIATPPKLSNHTSAKPSEEKTRETEAWPLWTICPAHRRLRCHHAALLQLFFRHFLRRSVVRHLRFCQQLLCFDHRLFSLFEFFFFAIHRSVHPSIHLSSIY